MRNALNAVAIVAAGLLLVAALSFAALWHYGYFAPRFEAKRREVFTNTPSYVQGKQQFLVRLHHEWENANAGHRESLCSLARHEAVTLAPEHLPSQLRTWECAR